MTIFALFNERNNNLANKLTITGKGMLTLIGGQTTFKYVFDEPVNHRDLWGTYTLRLGLSNGMTYVGILALNYVYTIAPTCSIISQSDTTTVTSVTYDKDTRTLTFTTSKAVWEAFISKNH